MSMTWIALGGPAERDRPAVQVVLPRGGLGVVDDLVEGRLADVEVGVAATAGRRSPWRAVIGSWRDGLLGTGGGTGAGARARGGASSAPAPRRSGWSRRAAATCRPASGHHLLPARMPGRDWVGGGQGRAGLRFRCCAGTGRRPGDGGPAWPRRPSRPPSPGGQYALPVPPAAAERRRRRCRAAARSARRRIAPGRRGPAGPPRAGSAGGPLLGPPPAAWLPAARRAASARSTERGCTVTPNRSATAAASCAEVGRGIGGQQAASRKSTHRRGQLVPALGARPGRDQAGQAAARPAPSGRCRALAGEAERRGRGGAQPARLDRAHHLVLDLHQVGGIEEGAGGEGRIGYLLPDAGSASVTPPARRPCRRPAWPCAPPAAESRPCNYSPRMVTGPDSLLACRHGNYPAQMS